MHQCLLYEKPRHCEHRTIYPRKNLMCLQDIGHRTWHQKWYQKCRYPRLQSALTQPIDLILYRGVYNNAHFTSSFSPTEASLLLIQETHTWPRLCSILIDTCISQRQKTDLNIQTWILIEFNTHWNERIQAKFLQQGGWKQSLVFSNTWSSFEVL